MKQNYCCLGFIRDELNLQLKLGGVEIKAVDYPLGGVALFFTSFRPDSAAWFEIRLPNDYSPEMVAGMIYVNICRVFPQDAPIWKGHFQSLNLALFQ